jgi:hypothetical protein
MLYQTDVKLDKMVKGGEMEEIREEAVVTYFKTLLSYPLKSTEETFQILVRVASALDYQHKLFTLTWQSKVVLLDMPVFHTLLMYRCSALPSITIAPTVHMPQSLTLSPWVNSGYIDLS